MPRGIRGRKSAKTEYKPVNAIIPKERDASGKLVDATDIMPWKDDAVELSAEEVLRQRQQQAAQAAQEAAAAKEAKEIADPKKLNAKQRKRLEAAALAKEKEAKRLALYATLAQHQAKAETLANLGSSSTLGAPARAGKRRRADRADDEDEDDEEMQSSDGADEE